jgi:hypothetical protein
MNPVRLRGCYELILTLRTQHSRGARVPMHWQRQEG